MIAIVVPIQIRIRESTCLTHVHSTVYVEGVTCDVACSFAGEEGDGACDIGVGSVASEGNMGEDRLFLGIGKGIGHGCLNETRGNCVHRDAAAGELAGKGFGETDEPGFGGGVVGLSGGSGLSYNRGDVDDAAPASFDHSRDNSLREEEGASEIGAEYVLKVGGAHAEGEAIFGDARVVDQDFNFPEVSDDGFDAGFDGIFAADVHGVGSCVAPCGCDLGSNRLKLFQIAGGESNGGTGPSELKGTGAPNALGCAGNKRNSSADACIGCWECGAGFNVVLVQRSLHPLFPQ